MQPMDLSTLNLPAALSDWIGDARAYESSGCSGAQTLLIDRDGGAFLKIAPKGALQRSAEMQAFWAEKGLSARVLMFCSEDRDFLLTEPVPGKCGVAPEHIAEPERLSALFGRSLRALHDCDASGCPVQNKMDEFLSANQSWTFNQEHLDLIAPYIGPARAESAREELENGRNLLQTDALIHGDCCLPNIMIHNWELTGWIDVGDSGLGDRHYDLAWGLWTLRYNLKKPRFGEIFLDAYGRDTIDARRLRLCGLLAGMN